MSQTEQHHSDKALDQVMQGLGELANDIVPWFFSNMHKYYFRSHPPQEQLRHLMAIISGQVTTANQTIALKSPCGTKVTYISPGSGPDNLLDIFEQIKDQTIQTARIYTSKDGNLSLHSLHFSETGQKIDEPSEEDTQRIIDDLDSEGLIKEWEQIDFKDFLACTTADYVHRFEPGRAARHFKIIKKIQGTERVHIDFEAEVYPGEDRLTISMNNPPARGLLLEIFKIFKRRDIPINRAYADLFEPEDSDQAAIVSLYFCNMKNEGQNEPEYLLNIIPDLKQIKWYCPDELECFADNMNWPIKRVCLLQAAAEFTHQILLRKDAYAYTLERIHKKMLKNPQLASDLIAYFQARFDPRKEVREDIISLREGNFRQGLEMLADEVDKNIFSCALNMFKKTLRTNYFLPDSLGLSFRMSPGILSDYPENEPPFGIFYFHGPGFLGFHVRYRDVSRGGVRLVKTKSEEHFKVESNRLVDEVTALALAQQYKNKDIPEGGSKAVLLMRPGADPDLTVKSMADSLLDIIISREDKTARDDVVDYLNRHEIIYLGPDENITPKHIEWVVERARIREYTWPSALMSSKAKAGINHKKYGVTSLGVIVFMEEVLKALGVDPYSQTFKIKMTGGPAGDVAGNAMRILNKKFGSKAEIIAVTDGHGAAYDPEGLDQSELLRLVNGNQRINAFNPDLLRGNQAFVLSADTPENIQIRDNLHNAAQADVFIPCGGRPETINSRNWFKFLGREERPSARAIIEGANIFISNTARQKLQEKGVLIIHGSSANKAGVISSSYEILAGLILNDQEFMEIKEKYVEQVLEILEKRTRSEARILLREYLTRGRTVPLTQITMQLSKEINTLGDLICRELQKKIPDLEQDELFCAQLKDYCPPELIRLYAGRLVRETPARHRFALLGAYLSSKIVYNEGLKWLEKMAGVQDIYKVVRAYLEEEKTVMHMLEAVAGWDNDLAPSIGKIISGMGRKHLTTERMGLS
ncbi:MAG: NAD-glutamate dehydrogenase domain-containing protein [Thermodesulfobacteriota bacterium]